MKKTDEIKIRVPPIMKREINRLAENRMTSESEIAREAFIFYLQSKGISLVAGEIETTPETTQTDPKRAKKARTGGAKGSPSSTSSGDALRASGSSAFCSAANSSTRAFPQPQPTLKT